ncbi:MAG: DUF1893 domain-containing protein [Leptospirales bacterium]|nr:DUF1893 domain-containing protein [Leptospirales bacterium]
MKDIEKAKQGLINETSFSLVNGDNVFTSKEPGVKPVLQLLESNKSLLVNASIADRVIGRAAALLMVLGGVKEVYGKVMSKPGYEALKQHGIGIDFDELVPNISNKTKTGLCPIEQSCLGIDDPSEAKRIILSTLSGKKDIS